MKRFPFLDWMRGLAVLVMIQCHTFNSFTRLDLRDGGPYVMTQFIGGMAAPLFLFMAGMTMGFQMDSLERKEPSPLRRWWISLRRAAYILGIAFVFRFTNWVFAWPLGDWHEMLRVDILNCMGAAMVALAAAACFEGASRVRFALLCGLAIAGAAPLISSFEWAERTGLLSEYLAAAPGRRFPLFPWASYVAFGIAMGSLVKRAAADTFHRLMEWSVLAGLALIFASQYFSNLPYSIYAKTDFWRDSPSLVLIRFGILLLTMAGAYLWTEYGSGTGWSWMQTLGRNSLMVYWVHVMIVYGSVVRPVKRSLSIGMASFATVVVTLAMILLSVYWLRWKGRTGKGKEEKLPRPSPPPLETTRTGY